jgi:hypothetical protein
MLLCRRAATANRRRGHSAIRDAADPRQESAVFPGPSLGSACDPARRRHQHPRSRWWHHRGHQLAGYACAEPGGHPDAGWRQHPRLHRRLDHGQPEPHHDGAGRRHRPVQRQWRHQRRIGPKTFASSPNFSEICTVGGNVTLVAPHGTIDVGSAGLRGTNIALAALTVLNAFNIQASGTVTGLSFTPPPNVTALIAASNANTATRACLARLPASTGRCQGGGENRQSFDFLSRHMTQDPCRLDGRTRVAA